MAFRKRNVGISRSIPGLGSASSSLIAPSASPAPLPGVRPSPIDGRPTTSTGTPSFDGILAGHAGFALGSSILIEESGTTDFAGALLRYYAAEGVVQGHKVHVIGVGEQWGRELPGLVGVSGSGTDDDGSGKEKKERMKIAWRYERLGEFGSGISGSRGTTAPPDRAQPVAEASTELASSSEPAAFCHIFDLAKRLAFPTGTFINFIPLPLQSADSSPFLPILQDLSKRLSSSPPSTVHRLVIPTLLSPALYPTTASQPHYLLQFLHSLRSLLRQYPTQLTALITLPLELYPRSLGLVRWMEMLSDGVLELTPFPHPMDALVTSGAATAHEERPQGMLKIHRLPVFHEKGGGGGGSSGLSEDQSRHRFLSFRLGQQSTNLRTYGSPQSLVPFRADCSSFLIFFSAEHIFHLDLLPSCLTCARSHCSCVTSSEGRVTRVYSNARESSAEIVA